MGFELWVHWKRHCCLLLSLKMPLSSSLSLALFLSPIALSHRLVWEREKPFPSFTFHSHDLTLNSRPSLSQSLVWAEAAPFVLFFLISFFFFSLPLPLSHGLPLSISFLSQYISLSMAGSVAPTFVNWGGRSLLSK